MRAVAVRRGGSVPRPIDVPAPTPVAGEALIQTLRVGIDGTDHEVLSGSHGGFPADDDHMILGHEAVGVVEDANDTDLSEGQLVVPTVRRPPNGENEYFDRGEPDMAPAGKYVERGIAGAHGYMAEYFTSPAEFLVPVDDTLAPHGFLVEPLSNAVKAVEHAEASRSAFTWDADSTLVLGNGPLGLLTLAMLVSDVERAYCIGRRDRPDPTINFVERLGATYVDSRETPVDAFAETHEGVDLAVEATGYARHAFEVVDALAPNGVAALLGIPEDWSFEFEGGRRHRDMVLQNKAIVGSVNSSIPHFERARERLAAVPDWVPDALITGVFSPDEATRAFEADDETLKAVVEFNAP